MLSQYFARSFGVVRSTGMTKAAYVDVIAQCMSEYNRINPLESATVAGLDYTLQAYSRIVCSMAVLVDYGAQRDITGFAEKYDCTLFESYDSLKALFATMMQKGCDGAITYAGKDVENFSVKELAIAYYLAKDHYDAQTVKAWAASLSQVQPDSTYYTHAEQTTNRNAYLIGGEQLRSYLCLADATAVEALISDSVGRQLGRFDENGMYRDNYGEVDEHDPSLYDLTTRVQMQLVLGFGYEGEYAQELDELLEKGGMMTLFTTSGNGELSYGGRSNQYLFNAALISANCEYEAVRYDKMGDRAIAGAYKRTAHLAILSIGDYLAANKHVMNYYADSAVGTESYGYYDKYMVTMSSFLAIAYLFADETIEEAAAPMEVGGYVMETSGYFNSIVASVGCYSIQILTSADDRYDSTGLGRIHKNGVYSALGLSMSLTASPSYTTPSGASLQDMSLSPVWYINGRRYALAEMNDLAHELYIISETENRVEFTLTWWGPSLMGVGKLQERYVLTDAGLAVTVMLLGSDADSIFYTVPLLATNGAENTAVAAQDAGFTVSLNGETYTVTSNADSASCESTKYANRNGEYYMGILKKEGNSITVTFTLD